MKNGDAGIFPLYYSFIANGCFHSSIPTNIAGGGAGILPHSHALKEANARVSAWYFVLSIKWGCSGNDVLIITFQYQAPQDVP